MSNTVKLWLLSTACLLAAVALGLTHFYFQKSIGLNSLIWLALPTLVFLTLFVFQSLLFSNPFSLAGLCLAETVAALAPLYKSFSITLLVATAAFFLILLNSARSGRKEARSLLKFELGRVANHIISKALVAVILLGVLAYMASFSFENVVSTALKSSLPAAQKILAQALPGLPAGAAVEQAQTLLTDQLVKLPDIVKKGAVVAFGLLIFFSIKGVSFIFTWPSTILAYLLYRLLLATKFVSLATEETTKETFQL